MRELSLLMAVLVLAGCGSSSTSPAAAVPSPTPVPPAGVCTFDIPAGPLTAGAQGGTIEIPVTTQDWCSWSITGFGFLNVRQGDGNGIGSRIARFDVAPAVGGRRQQQVRLLGSVRTRTDPTIVEIVRLFSTIEQEPLIVPVPSSPSYFYSDSPYPQHGGVTQVLRVGAGATIGTFNNGEQRVGITARPDIDPFGSDVSLTLEAPRGQALRIGTYEDAAGLVDSTSPHVSFTFGSQACNQNFGRFTIHDIAFSATRLERIRVNFEHHCEGTLGPPVVGEVWYIAR